MAPLLGYWNIRGLGQPCRLLFAYANVDVKEKRYNYGPPPEFDRSEWFNEKFNLGLEFPNLPYLIDGDHKVTQSVAVMRYLGRKYKLDGESEDEKIRIDMVEQQLVDFRTAYISMCYMPTHEQLKKDHIKNLPNNLKIFSEFLGKHKWFGGENISYVDFMIYEMFDQHQGLVPDCMKDYPNLQEYCKRFECLPGIVKYMKSDKYIKWPYNGDMAFFGSRLQKPPS